METLYEVILDHHFESAQSSDFAQWAINLAAAGTVNLDDALLAIDNATIQTHQQWARKGAA